MRNIITKERLWISAATMALGLLLGVLFLPKINSYTMDNKRFWLKKTFAPSKYDVVIVGDSRAYRGLAPEVLTDVTGLEVLNFGFSSARINSFMLHQASKKLSEKSTNKTIILAITANALTQHINPNEHIQQYLSMPREERWEALYFGDFLNYFEPIHARKNQVVEEKEHYLQDFRDNGWVASNLIPSDTSKALASYNRWFSKNKVSEKMLNELVQNVKKLRENGIRVIAFVVPRSMSMKILEVELAKFDESKLRKRLIQAGVEWIPIPDAQKYSTYDGSHLNELSAIQLSKYIGESIRQSEN